MSPSFDIDIDNPNGPNKVVNIINLDGAGLGGGPYLNGGATGGIFEQLAQQTRCKDTKHDRGVIQASFRAIVDSTNNHQASNS